MAYRLEITKTTKYDSNVGKYVNIPVEEFEYYPGGTYEDYNEADLERCRLCSLLNTAYVKIVEED